MRARDALGRDESLDADLLVAQRAGEPLLERGNRARRIGLRRADVEAHQGPRTWLRARVDVADGAHVGVTAFAHEPVAPLGAHRVRRIGLALALEPIQRNARRLSRRVSRPAASIAGTSRMANRIVLELDIRTLQEQRVVEEGQREIQEQRGTRRSQSTAPRRARAGFRAIRRPVIDSIANPTMPNRDSAATNTSDATHRTSVPIANARSASSSPSTTIAVIRTTPRKTIADDKRARS